LRLPSQDINTVGVVAELDLRSIGGHYPRPHACEGIGQRNDIEGAATPRAQMSRRSVSSFALNPVST
jgi:hypothetical protein